MRGAIRIGIFRAVKEFTALLRDKCERTKLADVSRVFESIARVNVACIMRRQGWMSGCQRSVSIGTISLTLP